MMPVGINILCILTFSSFTQGSPGTKGDPGVAGTPGSKGLPGLRVSIIHLLLFMITYIDQLPSAIPILSAKRNS